MKNKSLILMSIGIALATAAPRVATAAETAPLTAEELQELRDDQAAVRKARLEYIRKQCPRLLNADADERSNAMLDISLECEEDAVHFYRSVLRHKYPDVETLAAVYLANYPKQAQKRRSGDH